MATGSKRPQGSGPEQIVIKKYANRRLYNTATSSYVTLDELSQMVRDGQEFVVFDAKTGDDITRSVLTQIILEEDSKGRNLLPVSFLRQLIGYYDDKLHAFLPRYLELSMENFVKNQDQMRDYMGDAFGRMFPLSKGPLNQIEEMTRQNMTMFNRAASMFSPFQGPDGDPEGAADRPPERGSEPSEARGGTDEKPADTGLSDEMKSLKSEMAALKAQLEAMAKER